MPVKVLVWVLRSQRLLSFSLLLGTETAIVNVRPRLRLSYMVDSGWSTV